MNTTSTDRAVENTQIVVNSLDLDLTEKYLLEGCSDGIIRIRNLNDNKNVISELIAHSSPVKAFYVNHGEYIVSADFNGKFILWKLQGNSYSKKIERDINSKIYDISYRERQLILGCEGGIVKFLKFDENFNFKEEESLNVHNYGVGLVSCNSSFILTGGLDYKMFLIDINNKIEHVYSHKDRINCISMAPSNSFGKTIFAAGFNDGTLMIFERKENSFKKQEIDLEMPCLGLSWSKSGFVLSVVYGNENLKSFILGEDGEYEEIEMESVE
ncbi:MAG: hypothetical protein KC414_15265 [Romboutsia sp.]|nr:hypothetical protein [Romboutsia sp.]